MVHTNLPRSAESPDYLLALPEVKKRLGVRSDSTVYELMKRGFPRPVKLSRRMVRWSSLSVDAYVARCIDQGAK